MVTLEIKDFPVYVKIGVFPEERLGGQDLNLCLRAELDYDVWDLSDDCPLPDVVDYSQVIASIEKSLAGQNIELLEVAVKIVGNMLMDKFSRICSLNIKLEKPVIPNGLSKGAAISISQNFVRG
ncbi:MAG: dihydroneopterin aldolase [Bdellovibrionota bacterium]